MKIEDIAKICHQANKALCEANGDFSQKDWEHAADWQKDAAVDNVRNHLNDPEMKPSHSHESWMKKKLEDGWKYGPVKNADLKEHPSLLSYDQLSDFEKSKDYLFKSIVDGLSKFVNP